MLPTNGRFTTVANWKAYGSITYQGQCFGQKDEEFQHFVNLPLRCQQPLEIAVSGIGEDRKQFEMAGWHLRNGGDVSIDFDTYRNYIIASQGEFSVAKNAYVQTSSGWFSDRSVCYLAAGRPVVVQDTGFTRWMGAAGGVLPFSSEEEAAAQLARLQREDVDVSVPQRTAEEIFGYRVVLPRLLAATLR
jgi:hypothetical protein